MDKSLIIFCNCQTRQGSEKWVAASEILNNTERISIVSIQDLCGLCALEPGKARSLFEGSAKVLLLACQPRALKLLLQYAGIEKENKIRFFNLIEEESSALEGLLPEYLNEGADTRSEKETVSGSAWPSWYPVIDYKRCNNCMQCADFCLFGVYSKTGSQVKVVNPQGCKNNCPACARICPNVAIIFPKYSAGGPISGSVSVDEAVEMQRLKKDTESILGDDIYQALEQRKLKKRLMIREDALEQAKRERDEARQQLNIE